MGWRPLLVSLFFLIIILIILAGLKRDDDGDAEQQCCAERVGPALHSCSSYLRDYDCE